MNKTEVRMSANKNIGENPCGGEARVGCRCGEKLGVGMGVSADGKLLSEASTIGEPASR